MRSTRIIQHTTQNVRRFCQLHSTHGRPLSRAWSPYSLSLRSEHPSIKKSNIQGSFRYYQKGSKIYESRKSTADTVDPEPYNGPTKDAEHETLTVPRARKPTPPPHPGKNPRTLYSWIPPEVPDHGLGADFWPILNTTLTSEIEKKLQMATREAISLPEEQHQAHYKKAYEEIIKSSKYNVPVTDPPSETISIVAVDEIWSEDCRFCPCCCEDDIPYIQIHGSTEDGGKGVTFKMILEEVGDWLYGENAEEIIEGERGRVGLTILTYLEPGGEYEGNRLLEAKLYWYINKAEGGIKIGW
ncbi:uncharacterized protein DFL_001196 [Arthrobotrys flagrans]|uniref:Uncharacterized protein n=1 Tax=Arthrobotrys flagrans TaxID=97331 RepID=A0A437AGF9_ARTFL|nr:hypothetical protein DFL_001196 [Arthrobotrys flagrans]